MNTKDKTQLAIAVGLIVTGAATIAISFIKLNRLEKAQAERIARGDEATITVAERMSNPL